MTAMLERANAAFKKATDRRVFYDEDIVPVILRAALDFTEEEIDRLAMLHGRLYTSDRSFAIAVIAALRKAGGVE